MKAFSNSAIYAKEVDGQLPRLIFGSMEGLPKRKEDLEIFFDSYSSPKDDQHLLKGPFGEDNSTISTTKLCSTHS